jgi:hypothetical protein
MTKICTTFVVMSLFEKVKKRFGIESNKQMWLVLLTFTLTGCTIAFGFKPILYTLIGIADTTQWWVKLIVWLVFVLPFYYVFLLIYGAILGQFNFFWNWAIKSRINKFRKK